MTIAAPRFPSTISTTEGVYAPQDDSRFIIDHLNALTGDLSGKHVLDFCTGSGVVALAAARLGARSVTAIDVSPLAARCAVDNAKAAGLAVDVIVGSFPEAVAAGRYDLVVCNPPYVPAPISADQATPAGPSQAWDAGLDGRLVLDPLCAATPDLLEDGGTLLLVQSEFSGIAATLDALDGANMDAEVTARRTVGFGPVMASRAKWMEHQGLLRVGCREETLVVIAAVKR